MASFEEAEGRLTAAREYLALAGRSGAGVLVDTHLKTAFDALFHAARVAALTFMGSDRTGWGGVEKRLPPPWDTWFHVMASTLHVLCAYEGRVPRGMGASRAEYRRWTATGEQFVSAMRDLSAESGDGTRDAIDDSGRWPGGGRPGGDRGGGGARGLPAASRPPRGV